MNLGGWWLGLQCANEMRLSPSAMPVDCGMMLPLLPVLLAPIVQTSAESEITCTLSSLRFIIRRDIMTL